MLAKTCKRLQEDFSVNKECFDVVYGDVAGVDSVICRLVSTQIAETKL